MEHAQGHCPSPLLGPSRPVQVPCKGMDLGTLCLSSSRWAGTPLRTDAAGGIMSSKGARHLPQELAPPKSH
eukprot:6996946-Alexandrium_andersonii.AAC.1